LQPACSQNHRSSLRRFPRRADTVDRLGACLDAVSQRFDQLQPVGSRRVCLLGEIAACERILMRVEKNLRRPLDAGLRRNLRRQELDG
jgi:hypothetical protein